VTAFWARAILSGILIALASTIARRQPALGALVVSLPLVSILSMIWLWRDVPDAENMARHVESTFWYILPSMPMFLLIPALLRHGLGFWPSLLAGCVLTVALYAAVTLAAGRIGIRL
jgi:hypothetical protein